jgi:hypothetical protein
MEIICDDLWVCVDCAVFIANGDEPEDNRWEIIGNW